MPSRRALPVSIAPGRAHAARGACHAGLRLACALALSACGTPSSSPPLQALAACRSEVNAVIGSGDWEPSRLRRVDECMRARGWQPSKACVETAQQGSNFCEYRR